MKITDIKPATANVPLEAPLGHANGCHRGRAVTRAEIGREAARMFSGNFRASVGLPAPAAPGHDGEAGFRSRRPEGQV